MEEIMKASQFIAIVKRDYNINLQKEDVHLGRLNITTTEEASKDSGYVCFYAFLDEYTIYLKAYKGKTERKAKLLFKKHVCPKMEFRLKDSFRAIDNSLWHFVEVDEDYEIISDLEFKKRKGAKIA